MTGVGKRKDEHKEKADATAKDAAKQAKKPAHSAHAAGVRKKVFDVVPPGKAPASPTSRPVLPGQKPPVADGQFVAVKTAPTLRASDPNAKHNLMDPKKKKSVAPIVSEADVPAAREDKKAQRPAAEDSKPAETTATAPVLSRLKGMTAEAGSVSVSKEVQPGSAPAPVSAPAATPNAEPQKADPLPKTAPSFLDDDTETTPIWEMEEEPTPAHLAMEQVVDADDGVESHHLHGGPDADHAAQQIIGSGVVDAPGPSSTAAGTGDGSSASAGAHSSVPSGPAASAKTIDQLLAETGAPNLDTDGQPGVIISHHKTGGSILAKFFIILLTALVLAAIALNLLLDAGYIDTSFDLPHTNFL